MVGWYMAIPSPSMKISAENLVWYLNLSNTIINTFQKCCCCCCFCCCCWRRRIWKYIHFLIDKSLTNCWFQVFFHPKDDLRKVLIFNFSFKRKMRFKPKFKKWKSGVSLMPLFDSLQTVNKWKQVCNCSIPHLSSGLLRTSDGELLPSGGICQTSDSADFCQLAGKQTNVTQKLWTKTTLTLRINFLVITQNLL